MTDRFDLKGLTPESWVCVDCGINTFPGPGLQALQGGMVVRAAAAVCRLRPPRPQRTQLSPTHAHRLLRGVQKRRSCGGREATPHTRARHAGMRASELRRDLRAHAQRCVVLLVGLPPSRLSRAKRLSRPNYLS